MTEDEMIVTLEEHRKSCELFGVSWDSLLHLATVTILSAMGSLDNWSAEDISMFLYRETSLYVYSYNRNRPKNQHQRYLDLAPMQIAYAIMYKYRVCRIPCAGDKGNEDLDLLGIYQEGGPDKGLYAISENSLNTAARGFKHSISKREQAEVMQVLRDLAPRKARCTDKDLIAVDNGIFNYKTKKLEPFSPERVFLKKSRVKYVPNAINPIIFNPEDGTYWDVESWMNELSDNSDVVELLWQIIGAIIRPFVRWRRCAIFYSSEGNNGKGTLCELMRNICGSGNYTDIPMEMFGKDFMLEDLIGASAIIVDENNVGSYLDRAAALKAVVTNDVVHINRKNKPAIPYQFYGFMVQCFNEFPRTKDKTNSIYRRCLFVNFKACFTGRERTYIKDTYLHRSDVLEYVLHKVLHMDYYELSTPKECLEVLEDFKVYNDPIRQWWEDVSGQFIWDLLPFRFLYALYIHWFDENNPGGRVVGRNAFIEELRRIAEHDAVWECPRGPDGKDKKIPAAGRIVLKTEEPIAKYYYMPDGNMKDNDRFGRYLGKAEYWQGSYRGLLRRQPSQNQNQGQSGTAPVAD